MMGAFLDALGIAHENGLIQDDGVTPDPAKIESAAAEIAQQFGPDSVSLYLNTLLCQIRRPGVRWPGCPSDRRDACIPASTSGSRTSNVDP